MAPWGQRTATESQAEQLMGDTTLNIDVLKRFVGGPDVRQTHAGILLVFDVSHVPSFDECDPNFREKLIFVPLRSKFVMDALSHKEPFTFEVNYATSMKFPAWMSALADIFIEHRGMIMDNFETLPQSMTSWRGSVVAPAAQWCDTNLQVTGNNNDYVILGELDSGIHKFVNLAKEFYAARSDTRASYCPKTSVMIEGKYVTKRNVLRGVKRIRV